MTHLKGKACDSHKRSVMPVIDPLIVALLIGEGIDSRTGAAQTIGLSGNPALITMIFAQ